MTKDERPIVYPDPEPDRLERVVRIVCGVLLGVGVGIATCLRARLAFGPGPVVMIASMACCAWGALRWGDEFWMANLRRGR